MKNLISILFLLVFGTSAFAQKTYLNATININSTSYSTDIFATLSGDIPYGVSRDFKWSDFDAYRGTNTNTYYAHYNIADFINYLTKRGYYFENTTVLKENQIMLLFSRGSSNPMNGIQKIEAGTGEDEEVTEIARYNLQGIPVSESEKGIQIIVYSNYTTKTIIRE